jgi:hypothetical protein
MDRSFSTHPHSHLACYPGRYRNGITCTDCNAGKYSNTVGAISISTCTDCEAGKYSNSFGAISISTCTECDAGKYSNTVGSGSCTDCDAGKYSSSGSIACCSSGTMWTVDKSMCLNCPLQKACITGYICEVGYGGLGCTQCSQDYFLLNDAAENAPETNIYLLISLGLLFTLIFGTGVYYLSGKLIDLAGITTISIGHFQTVTLFLSINVPIPQLFRDIEKIQAFFAFMYIDLFFSPDCVSSFDFYERWSLLSFIPILLMLVVFLFESCQCNPTGRMMNITFSAFLCVFVESNLDYVGLSET